MRFRVYNTQMDPVRSKKSEISADLPIANRTSYGMEKLKPFTENRPWGGFREFIENEKDTVKILFIKKGEAFSLQKHHYRDEFWRVLSGNPDVTIGDETIRAKVGDEFEIPPETKHQVSTSMDDVEILEISRGRFEESDIVRIEDKYGRI